MSLQNLIILFIGVIWGLIVGVIPGLGGLIAMALLLPFIYGMEPAVGISLLLAAHASVGAGGAITSILINTPGSPENAATTFDGYRMAQKGQALQALGMAASSSTVGGFFGIIVLVAAIPFLRMIMMSIGSAEYALLALSGIVVIGMLQADTRLKGVISGIIGLLLSFVGYDPVSGAHRFTFGMLELADGLQFVPVLIGLFALSEMFRLFREDETISSESSIEKQSWKQIWEQIWEGCLETFRYWGLVLRSSTVGTIIGIIPGLGGSVASFLAYGQAQQTSKHPELFGTGIPEGVIAPESANNAKEGGALIPTLAFGIPGSAGMALLVGAMFMLGITPGPQMLTTHLSTVFSMTWALVFATVFSAVLSLAAAAYLVKLTRVPAQFLVPFIIAVCLIGAYAVRNSFFDVVITVIFGLLGYYFKMFGFSPAAVVVGLILGKIAEQNISITRQAYGWSFLSRPVSIVLMVILLIMIVWPFIQERQKKQKRLQF